MTNILIVTNSPGGGGAERSMNLLANAMQNDGFKVSLITLNSGVNDLVSVTAPTFNLNRNRESGLFSTVIKVLEFRKLVKKLNAQTVILNCDLPEFYGVFLPLRMTLITIEHSNPAWTTRRNLGRIIRLIHLIRRTHFFAVSAHLNVWPWQIKPLSIVNNLIHCQMEESDRTNNAVPFKRLTYIGRLAEEQKRTSYALKVAKELQVPLLLIGNGAAKKSLEITAQIYDLKVEFAGHQNDPWELIEMGDVLMVPSSFEGDGLVVVEAIAKRIPIIISDIEAFRRFQLPEIHYASTEVEFSEILERHRDDVRRLIVPIDLSRKIIRERESEYVLEQWKKALLSI